ncbi:MAG: hypothetical protein Q8L34_05575, partial [Candidatus Woesearchaeota archaeon]|nr:hypothetical protein [Candidatus Woesearchaeota archaeon]
MEIKRKGIIFALDAALAVSVVIIILINSSYYFSTSSKESLSQLQPVRIGSDIMALLDFSGDINSAILQDSEADGDTIPQANLNVTAYLPKNYAMKYAITDMKETRTYFPGAGDEGYCPESGGEYENCKTDDRVTCDDEGCILEPNQWLKIKPITEPTRRADIINQGEHFVIVNTDQTNQTLSTLSLKVSDLDELDNANLTSSSSIFDSDTKSYFYYFAATNPLRLPYFEAGPSDNNWLTLTNTGTSNIKIFWIR